MTRSDDRQEPSPRWDVRPRGESTPDGAPPASQVLRTELARIEHRVEDVIAQGRAAFVEDSESYDRATVAVLRLAALFEEEKRFGTSLTVVTTDERRGITTTRDIAARSGCGAMSSEILWRTVTERIPDVVARIHAALDA